MKVAITGATGFIGRHLAETLHEDGVSVAATGRAEDVGRQLAKRGIAFRPADLRDPVQLGEAIPEADCLVHCAGKSADWGEARAFEEVNVVGTRNAIGACQRAGIRRVIFISTPSVYFDGSGRLGLTEAAPLPRRPLTHYARTKLMAERELLALTSRGFEVIVLRPRAVHGPRDRTIAPRLLHLARRRRFPLIGGGQALTDITYVDNLCHAIRRCLDAPESAWNRIYNISNGEPIRVRDWFAALLEVFGQPFLPRDVPEPAARLLAAAMEAASRLPFGPEKPAFTRFSVGYMARSMTLSIESARQRLGYEPLVDNRGGFARYARWYRRRQAATAGAG